jgi:hypothetical protein
MAERLTAKELVELPKDAAYALLDSISSVQMSAGEYRKLLAAAEECERLRSLKPATMLARAAKAELENERLRAAIEKHRDAIVHSPECDHELWEVLK